MTEETSERILFVDDEELVLKGLTRRLQDRFDIVTAQKGAAGLVTLRSKGPFAVVVSDLRMPGMDGVAFLSRVKCVDPDTVRMLLSGNADLEAAMDAINRGGIFRILAKPCGDDILVPALESGIAQYRMVRSERELLEQTLRGSVRALTDVLALANPQIFGRAMHVQHYVAPVLAESPEPIESWPIEVAVMLSQIGSIMLSDELVAKVCEGGAMSEEEESSIRDVPGISEELLESIPRLDPVRDILKSMHLDYAGCDEASPAGADIPWGGRLLRILFDFESLRLGGGLNREILEELRSAGHRYDEEILVLFEKALEKLESESDIVDLGFRKLRVGMRLMEPIMSRDNRLLVAGGQEVTPGLLKRLKQFGHGVGINDPIRVRISE